MKKTIHKTCFLIVKDLITRVSLNLKDFFFSHNVHDL